MKEATDIVKCKMTTDPGKLQDDSLTDICDSVCSPCSMAATASGCVSRRQRQSCVLKYPVRRALFTSQSKAWAVKLCLFANFLRYGHNDNHDYHIVNVD